MITSSLLSRLYSAFGDFFLPIFCALPLAGCIDARNQELTREKATELLLANQKERTPPHPLLNFLAIANTYNSPNDFTEQAQSIYNYVKSNQELPLPVGSGFLGRPIQQFLVLRRDFQLGYITDVRVEALHAKSQNCVLMSGCDYIITLPSVSPDISKSCHELKLQEVNLNQIVTDSTCALDAYALSGVEVTGIYGDKIKATAEYKVTFEPNELGKKYKFKAITPSQKMNFTHYDDGWRIGN